MRRGAARQYARSLEALFVALVVAVSLLAVLAAKSDWVAAKLQARVEQGPVALERDGQRLLVRPNLSCLPSRESDPCEVTAAFDYTDTHDPAQGRIAILVDQFSGDLMVRVNGVVEFATYDKGKMLRLLPQRPVLVELPGDVLTAGDNRIEVTLRSSSILGGYLSRLVVGPQSELAASFEAGLFWLFSVPTLFGGALLLIACITSYLALRHRDMKFLLCAVVSLSFSVSMLYDILPIETPDALLVGIRLLRMVAGAYTMAFIYRVSELEYPISMRALAAFPLAFFAVFMLSASRYEAGVATIVFWMLLIVLMLHGTIDLAMQLWRAPKKTSRVLFVMAVFGLIGVVTNFAQTLGYSFNTSNVLRGYGPIMFVTAISFYLVIDLSHKTLLVDRANDAMSAEIRRVTRTLQETYMQADAHRRTALLQAERQRLMGDLHDGLAGNLITIQALACDNDPASPAQIHTLARRALLDLRLVVESLDSFDGDLAAVLAAFRERIAPQYSQGQVLLDWDFADAPRIPDISPEISITIFRVLQEAVANAVRHGSARNIRIGARAMRGNPSVALIFVLDDGVPSVPVQPGFGMRNMKRRARAIGAQLWFRFTPRGTVVLLRLDPAGGSGSRGEQ